MKKIIFVVFFVLVGKLCGKYLSTHGNESELVQEKGDYKNKTDTKQNKPKRSLIMKYEEYAKKYDKKQNSLMDKYDISQKETKIRTIGDSNRRYNKKYNKKYNNNKDKFSTKKNKIKRRFNYKYNEYIKSDGKEKEHELVVLHEVLGGKNISAHQNKGEFVQEKDDYKDKTDTKQNKPKRSIMTKYEGYAKKYDTEQNILKDKSNISQKETKRRRFGDSNRRYNRKDDKKYNNNKDKFNTNKKEMKRRINYKYNKYIKSDGKEKEHELFLISEVLGGKNIPIHQNKGEFVQEKDDYKDKTDTKQNKHKRSIMINYKGYGKKYGKEQNILKGKSDISQKQTNRRRIGDSNRRYNKKDDKKYNNNKDKFNIKKKETKRRDKYKHKKYIKSDGKEKEHKLVVLPKVLAGKNRLTHQNKGKLVHEKGDYMDKLDTKQNKPKRSIMNKYEGYAKKYGKVHNTLKDKSDISQRKSKRRRIRDSNRRYNKEDDKQYNDNKDTKKKEIKRRTNYKHKEYIKNDQNKGELVRKKGDYKDKLDMKQIKPKRSIMLKNERYIKKYGKIQNSLKDKSDISQKKMKRSIMNKYEGYTKKYGKVHNSLKDKSDISRKKTKRKRIRDSNRRYNKKGDKQYNNNNDKINTKKKEIKRRSDYKHKEYIKNDGKEKEHKLVVLPEVLSGKNISPHENKGQMVQEQNDHKDKTYYQKKHIRKRRIINKCHGYIKKYGTERTFVNKYSRFNNSDDKKEQEKVKGVKIKENNYDKEGKGGKEEETEWYTAEENVAEGVGEREWPAEFEGENYNYKLREMGDKVNAVTKVKGNQRKGKDKSKDDILKNNTEWERNKKLEGQEEREGKREEEWKLEAKGGFEGNSELGGEGESRGESKWEGEGEGEDYLEGEEEEETEWYASEENEANGDGEDEWDGDLPLEYENKEGKGKDNKKGKEGKVNVDRKLKKDTDGDSMRKYYLEVDHGTGKNGKERKGIAGVQNTGGKGKEEGTRDGKMIVKDPDKDEVKEKRKIGYRDKVNNKNKNVSNYYKNKSKYDNRSKKDKYNEHDEISNKDEYDSDVNGNAYKYDDNNDKDNKQSKGDDNGKDTDGRSSKGGEGRDENDEDVKTKNGTKHSEDKSAEYLSEETGCQKGNGETYRGIMDKNQGGIQCQKWTDQYPNIHHQMAPDRQDAGGTGHHNYCRNPDGAEGVWCYGLSGKRWDYCNVPKCECQKGNGESYRGIMDKNQGGIQCQKWTDQYPNIHYQMAPDRQEVGGTGHHNYCRNPDGAEGVWCYGLSGKRWEYCNVPKCENDTRSSGSISSKGWRQLWAR